MCKFVYEFVMWELFLFTTSTICCTATLFGVKKIDNNTHKNVWVTAFTENAFLRQLVIHPHEVVHLER